MCHRIIIVAGQGLGATEELEQKEYDTEGGKDTVRILDEYTRLLLFPESLGGCFIVCLRQGPGIPGFRRTWFVV